MICNVYKYLYQPEAGPSKLVVACEDFLTADERLYDFGMIKNSCIVTGASGYSLDVRTNISAIREQQFINPQQLEEFYWDMFVVDAFIGNINRDNTNWGVIVNHEKGTSRIAPVYDCGESLNYHYGKSYIEKVMSNENPLLKLSDAFEMSAIKFSNNKIFYDDSLKIICSAEACEAVLRIAPKIDMKKINAIVDNAPCISQVEKDFYKYQLKDRKERIIDNLITTAKNMF